MEMRDAAAAAVAAYVVIADDCAQPVQCARFKTIVVRRRRRAHMFDVRCCFGNVV